MVTTEERFLAKVQVSDGECRWLWSGTLLPDGYGQFWMGGRQTGGRMQYAHRVAYELFVGPLPSGGHEIEVDHTCHDPNVCRGGKSCPHRRCVWPPHLEAVSQSENTQRRLASHCKRGHLRTPENTAYAADGGRRCLTCKREAGRLKRTDGEIQQAAARAFEAKYGGTDE